MKTQQGYDYLFKIVVAGEPNVGKRTLIQRYVNDIYYEDGSYQMNECTIKTITVKDKKAKLNIYNTQGLEKQRDIGESYYGGVHAAMVCFDATDSYTLNSILDLVKVIERYSQHAEFLLVETKSDEECGIEDSEIENVARTITSHGEWIKTSSKTGMNVNESFEKITEILIEKAERKKEELQHPQQSNNQSRKSKKTSKKKSCILL